MRNYLLSVNKLNTLATVKAVSQALQRIDPRLINHGERVAYIACQLCEQGNVDVDEKKIFLLSLFHDIGAYKTDEIDKMVEFETHDVHNHSIYGSLFLKYMSPLSDFADAILYHHTSWEILEHIDTPCKNYSALINLADRLDIIYLHQKDKKLLKKLKYESNSLFKPEFVDIATETFVQNVFEHLDDGEYNRHNQRLFDSLNDSLGTSLDFLKMLVFSIDFRSEYTVTHTVNTVSIALDVGEYFGLNQDMLSKIYLGALIHDIGKIAVPIPILEKPSKLNDKEMQIMRTHVVETERIIANFIPIDICNIACRHHEKLDGSGYPHGLSAEQLNLPERIIAVADIVSALANRRSYKEPFPKNKIIEILQQMKGKLLDENVCEYICNNYDTVMEHTDNRRSAVMTTYDRMLDDYQRLKNQNIT